MSEFDRNETLETIDEFISWFGGNSDLIAKALGVDEDKILAIETQLVQLVMEASESD